MNWCELYSSQASVNIQAIIMLLYYILRVQQAGAIPACYWFLATLIITTTITTYKTTAATDKVNGIIITTKQNGRNFGLLSS